MRYHYIEIAKPGDDCRCLARISTLPVFADKDLESNKSRNPELTVRYVISSAKEKEFNYQNL